MTKPFRICTTTGELQSFKLGDLGALGGGCLKRIWKTISSYIWWTHDRGTFHYDVMVILILAFIFVAPLWMNFNDKPAERNPHPIEVVVHSDPQGSLVYEIDPSAVEGADDAAIREGLVRVIEPVSGEIELLRYEKVRDQRGRLLSYRAWVKRR